MKTAIITGGTGFLGGNLIRRLCKENYRVYAVVRPESQNLSRLPLHDNIHPVLCRLDALAENADWLPANCDVFFHFAWSGVNRAEIDSEPVHHQNLDEAVQVLKFAVDSGARCFVDAGSRSEYGRQTGWFKEDLSCRPQVAYGRYKLAFFRFASEYCAKRGTQYIHPRIFSVYGPGDHPWSLICSAVKHMLCDEPMSLSTCTQLWNFMDVRDAVDLILTMCEQRCKIPDGDNGIFNVATKDIRPLRRFVEEIQAITGSHSALSFGSFEQGADSAMSICPDMTKVEQTFGWKQRITFDRGIRDLIEYVRNEYA